MITEDEYENLKEELEEVKEDFRQKLEKAEEESAARMQEICRLRGIVRWLEDELKELQQTKDAKNDEQTENE